MGLDIKIPIGLMFAVFGILLSIFGLMTGTDATMYEISLGHNINLWSGISMLVFGGFMLVLAFITKKKESAQAE